MANASRPSRYAADERQERALLADLGFVGASQRAYCLDNSIPIQKIRDELHRVYAEEMCALDASIMAGPRPSMAAPTCEARVGAPTAQAAQSHGRQSEIERAFGAGPAEDGVKFDSRSQVQTFSFTG